MKTDEIRESFLYFFEERAHKRVASDSLVPASDPTLLFSGAGMNQFKDLFIGRGSADYRRATTAQKCFRTGDIDSVGRTAGHHTLFEMMGNFSFGDYFKQESILWAWEWLTSASGLPEKSLSVSVYLDDDEAADIWLKEIGVPKKKLYRFDEHENFWPADAPSQSPAGTLCGPCSEIFYDRGEKVGCGRKECDPSCDCDRYVEIWNLVFQQFEKGEKPKELTPLSTKNIDTGLGLERMAAVMQGVRSNFEIDIFRPLVERAAELTGKKLKKVTPDELRRLRRIADHARAVTFCIADGALPSNEGRGYVVRRILRRAVLDGRALGLAEPFLHEMVPVVVELMGRAYPEIAGENAGRIIGFVGGEEERFGATIAQGLRVLEESMRAVTERGGKKVFSGGKAFVLYDTYGFPPELTREMLAERGVEIDEEGFEKAMARQRERSRAGSKLAEDIFAGDPAVERIRAARSGFRTDFRGYGETVVEAEVVELDDGGANVRLVTTATPFYAESGGQVGDTGVITGPSGKFAVEQTTAIDGITFHHGRVTEGEFSVGEKGRLEVDGERRAGVARNHTATHLLHAALRRVLGTHVTQKGSLVSAERLRFDFTHSGGLKGDELERVERIVNEEVMRDRASTPSARPSRAYSARAAAAFSCRCRAFPTSSV